MTLFIFFVFFICDSAWIQSNKQLPTAKSSAAIGSYNNAVYILGGTSPGGNGMNIYRLIKYDTVTDQTTDDGNALNYGTFGISTYYTQIYHTLYIIQSGGANIWYYNLQNQISNAIPQNIPDTVHDCGCLASNDLQLFVVGGSSGSLSNMGSTLATMQVYDLSNSNWLNNVPSMQESRCSHSCIVDPIDNMLYVIGGFKIIDSSKDPPLVQYSATIDTIDTNNNIIDNSWSYIDALPIAIGWSSAVYFDDNIYIIGGAYGDYPWNGLTYVKSVYIIDTITETVSESSDSLNYRISNTVASVVNGIVYVFGGYDGVMIDAWMSYVLPTNSPSNIPTDSPSNKPSDEPSNKPSNAPSNIPSNIPSNVPSNTPSNIPSDSTSIIPSNTPSNTPSDSTSIKPSNIPSMINVPMTTKWPFDSPSDKPTQQTDAVITEHAQTLNTDTESTVADDIVQNEHNMNAIVLIWIMVIATVTLCLAAGFMIFTRYKPWINIANMMKEDVVITPSTGTAMGGDTVSTPGIIATDRIELQSTKTGDECAKNVVESKTRHNETFDSMSHKGPVLEGGAMRKGSVSSSRGEGIKDNYIKTRGNFNNIAPDEFIVGESLDDADGGLKGTNEGNGTTQTMYDTSGNTTNTNNGGEAVMDICAYCGLMKVGKVYDSDGLFYCNECWQWYS